MTNKDMFKGITYDSLDKQIGGKYLIGALKHVIRQGKGQTRLGLIRDSVGREGKPHSGSMVNK